MVDLEQSIVYLNGRIIQTVMSANEEEGWVEIVDVAKMAPLTTEEADLILDDGTLQEWDVVPTKRLYGEVKIISIP